jgi:DNA-binding CsgD family transcriptional regulator
VAPLPPQDSGSRRQPAAILFISDPDLVVEPNRILLQNTFGLTEAEARVAAALARGQNIEQIAAEFQLSPETIRTHLKKVFAKTDTSRQGELIRLLLASWNTIRIVDETPR